jgi:WD repeat-containing protein 19
VRQVLLWHLGSQTLESVDLSLREPTFLRWSRSGSQLAIGTARGELLLYDRASRSSWYAAARHKKRLTCGDWNSAGQFAFASDDRQISIVGADGKTFGQVKVKSRPTNVKFGGERSCGGTHAAGTSGPNATCAAGAGVGSCSGDRIVSVSMERKTILLYNLSDPENALELAFQSRYGVIVSFKWSVHTQAAVMCGSAQWQLAQHHDT